MTSADYICLVLNSVGSKYNSAGYVHPLAGTGELLGMKLVWQLPCALNIGSDAVSATVFLPELCACLLRAGSRSYPVIFCYPLETVNGAVAHCPFRLVLYCYTRAHGLLHRTPYGAGSCRLAHHYNCHHYHGTCDTVAVGGRLPALPLLLSWREP